MQFINVVPRITTGSKKSLLLTIEYIKDSLCSDIPIIYVGKCQYVPLRTTKPKKE